MVKIDEIESSYFKLFSSYLSTSFNSFLIQQKLQEQKEQKETILNYILSFILNYNYNFILSSSSSSSLSFNNYNTLLILFFLYFRKIFPFSFLFLIISFLLNINPLYIIISYLSYHIYSNRFNSYKYKGYQIKKNLENIKNNNLKKERKIHKFDLNIKLDENKYDYILIGHHNSINILLIAALLSRIGRKCCILEPNNQLYLSSDLTPLKCIHPQFISKIFHVLFQEPIIQLSPVGKVEEGYAHTIISFKMLNDKFENIVIRPGIGTLIKYFSESSMCTPHQVQCLSNVFAWCSECCTKLVMYLMFTVHATPVWLSKFGNVHEKFISLITSTTCTDITHEIVEGTYISSALAALTAWYSGEYSCSFQKLGSINLINSLSSNSIFTISGGYSILREKLVEIIYLSHGIIITDVPIKQCLYENNGVTGVSIKSTDTKVLNIKSKYGVISGMSAIYTFTNFIPLSITSSNIESSRMKLKKLNVKKPKLYIVYHINGTSESLEISILEYLELHDNSNDNYDNSDNKSNNYDDYENQSFKIWSPSARNMKLSEVYPNTETLIFEMEAPNFLIRKVKDPKYEFTSYSKNISNWNDIEFDKVKKYALSCITRIYPKIKPVDIHNIKFYPPAIHEDYLSATVEKYMANIGAKTDIKGLYLSGQDILTNGFNSDVFSAISTTCAVLDYSLNELFLHRNIITDLQKSN